MGREPPSHLRRVALARVDVHLVVGVFAVAVDNVFAVKCVVLFERFVRPKSASIDNERLLLAVGQQSRRRSSAAFTGITYRCRVPRSAIMKTGGLSPLYEPRPRVDRPRERDSVALAAFLSGRDVHFVDFDRADKIEGRRIGRSGKALVAPVHRLCVTSISHCS